MQRFGFREGIITVSGICMAGFLLQLTVGSFDFYLLAAPVNYMAAGMTLLLCLLTVFVRNSLFIRWFTGVPLTVCLLSALVLLTLIMGLTPQQETSNFPAKLGFNAMTTSWAFVLVYFVTILSLGSLIVRRLCSFKWRDYVFYLNHIGLWIVLLAAGVGSADMERYIMYVQEGETEWRVYDAGENVKELPIAVQLNDFDMETYPPQLTVIDLQTGAPQPEGKPDYYQIDVKQPEGTIDGWEISLLEYIHNAIRNSDSTYREVPMPGATPAARIKAVNPKTGETHEGWVCGGNQAQLFMTLKMSDNQSIVMTVAEPKKFISDIDVYTESGEKKHAGIEVNKPLKIGDWTVYQYGYDNTAGRLSSYSSFELVYDPWCNYVYIGFALLAVGMFFLIINGKRNES
ncbi:MAG: cytochrome c biogenesis protein ResB [Tannerella sp.]|jgi:hypothetical protein|nr:cytochrome c biogenesis protein ResB [Tannerella sp.]